MLDLKTSMIKILYFGIVITAFYVYINNLTTRKLITTAGEFNKKLERIAYFDQETGLPNGQHLENDLEEWSPQNIASDEKLILAGFRLDGLDHLNETKGLAFTTSILRRVTAGFSKRLEQIYATQTNYRPLANLALLYRAESGIFLFPYLVMAGARPDEKKFREILWEIIHEINRAVPSGTLLRFQGGFTMYPDDSQSPTQLMRNMLNLLHVNRNSASGTFEPFNAVAYHKFLRQEQVRETLTRAISGSELTAAFQPKVRITDRSLAGFEALARWDSKTLGSISPTEFIPVAEQCGLIDLLTHKILEVTLALVEGLLAQGAIEFRISINLSPCLLDSGFLHKVYVKLRHNRLTKYLEFEITEGMLMEIDQRIAMEIGKLRSLGIAFTIDDFGTGYSNLSYLQNFEAETLKIDKRFIDGIPRDEKNTRLVRTIIHMAKLFEMKVVAEGVEQAEQGSFLAEIGCDQAQGYLYSRPLNFEAALSYKP